MAKNDIGRVDIHHLDIRLGGQDIIGQLSLDVADGEFLVLLGPSGCGKSTLLHSIAGLIDVSGGSIAIGGRDITWADPKDRGIGMVFQSYALYPTMTVERNMSFGLRLAGTPKDVITQRVDKAARMLHLGELLQRKPAQLSGGQRQRVAIGRALVREAAVYLFDEPLSNLDAKLRAELRRELKQLHKDIGATMIYVTHDQVEAMTLATRIAVMRGGRIQQVDTPAAVYSRPVNMFVAGFLGSPSMNFVEGTLQRVDGRPHFAGRALSLDLGAYAFQPGAAPVAPGTACVLGVRPEALALCAAGTPGSFPATVTLVEPMGALQIVWLDAGGQQLSVQVDAQDTPAADTPVGILAQAGGVSLFDAATQARL